MPVTIGNNSQLNNSPVWAVMSPWMVTTSAMLLGQPAYRNDSGLGGGLDSVTAKPAMNEIRGYGLNLRVGQFSPLTTASAMTTQTNDRAHYQPNSSVLRPGKLTSYCQAAAAETSH